MKKLLIILGFATQAAWASLGNPKAIVGGTFVLGLSAYPKSLNYYLANEEFTSAVNQLVLEALIEINIDTYEPIPRLAKSWSISPDKKTYTFKLNPLAKFSDGKPVTSRDVQFTWETLFNPKNKTVPFQSLFSSFESCHAVDPLTTQFKAKIVHFQNLEKLADFLILPSHIYGDKDFNKSFNNHITGSGAYRIESVAPGEKITLKRNNEYWGFALPQNIGRYNFDKIIGKAISDSNVQYEVFKKGDIDYFYFLSAKMWATETDGPTYQKNYTLKLKGENLAPMATQGIAWNLRRPLFKDLKVRLALSHLLNRERLIPEIFYNNYRASTGIVSPDSPYHPKGLKPLAFDPKRTKTLLAEAGWSTLGPDGILVKDGQKFEFEMLIDNPSHQRYLTIYQEDLKKMGIQMNIRVQDWAACLKLMDDWQFDAHLFARSRTVHPFNLTDEWGSAQAGIKGSGNVFGYKNTELDTLAAQIDKTFDIKKRLPMVQKVVSLIARDIPMTPTWEGKYFRVGYWNKFSFPGKGYFKYSAWRDAFQYWWYDAKKDEALKAAMARNESLK